MKFKVWYEAIAVPPHLPHKWLKDSLQKSKELENELKDLPALYKKAVKYIEENTSKNLSQEFEDIIPYDLMNILNHHIKQDYRYQPISKNIEDYLGLVRGISDSTRNYYFKKISDIGRVNEFIKNYSEFFKKEKYDKEILSRLEDSKDYIDDYDDVISTVTKAQNKLHKLLDYVKFSKELDKKIQAILARQEINYAKNTISFKPQEDKDKISPKHLPFEILYHATPFLKEVLAQGFKIKDRQVLGGATDNSISFTADIEIARAIAQELIVVIDIAHKRVTIKDIVEMMKKEGLNPKTVMDSWLTDFRGMKKSKKLGYKSWSFQKEPIDPSDVRYWDEQSAFGLYRRYLAHSQEKYDPLFFGVDVSNFKGLDRNNVGIIAAKVEMSKIKKYLQSMEEFRVPLDGILSISQVK